MKFFEIFSGLPLSEAPQIVGVDDFGMGNDQKKYEFTRMLLSLPDQQVVEDNERYEIRRAGSPVVYFYMLEKPHGTLVYFVKCEIVDVPYVGKTVTQVALWRDQKFASTQGITKKIFFDQLLKEWPIIMSDEAQTERGRDFWVSRMATAAEKGLRIGLVNTREKTVDWRKNEPYPEWIAQREHAWSANSSAQAMRFVISR